MRAPRTEERKGGKGVNGLFVRVFVEVVLVIVGEEVLLLMLLLLLVVVV